MAKNTSQKINSLKQEALKWEGLHRISQSTEYQEYLKPLLQEQFQNKWLDPAQFNSLEEFHKAYSEAWGRAQAYKEIYNMLESAGKVAQNMAEQIKSPQKDYAIT
jgi:hypothetical protein